MSLVFWILISFVSASVPWSLILGYIFSNKDIRTVGDKNPGGTNTLKLSGIKVGLMAIFLDISKIVLFLSLLSKYNQMNTDTGIIIATSIPKIGIKSSINILQKTKCNANLSLII